MFGLRRDVNNMHITSHWEGNGLGWNCMGIGLEEMEFGIMGHGIHSFGVLVFGFLCLVTALAFSLSLRFTCLLD